MSIGDMILDSLNLNSWSGNSGYILSYNGIHYTMIPCIILAVISWAIAHRHPKDYGAKTAKIISARRQKKNERVPVIRKAYADAVNGRMGKTVEPGTSLTEIR